MKEASQRVDPWYDENNRNHDQVMDQLRQKLFEKKNTHKLQETDCFNFGGCCLKHYLPEGYTNYINSYDNKESLKLYAISSSRFTRGVIVSSDIQFSIFSRIKFAPLECQKPEDMQNGMLNDEF